MTDAARDILLQGLRDEVEHLRKRLRTESGCLLTNSKEIGRLQRRIVALDEAITKRLRTLGLGGIRPPSTSLQSNRQMR